MNAPPASGREQTQDGAGKALAFHPQVEIAAGLEDDAARGFRIAERHTLPGVARAPDEDLASAFMLRRL